MTERSSCEAQISWSPQEHPEIVNDLGVVPAETRVILRVDCKGCPDKPNHGFSLARTCDTKGIHSFAKELILEVCPVWNKETRGPGNLPYNWHPQLGKNGKFAKKD